MRKQKTRRRRRTPRPLRVSLAERVGSLYLDQPEPQHHPALMPSPPRSTRSIVELLLAATGFALAARRSARVELLPGEPTTVVIYGGDLPAAAFVLPIDHEQACMAFGQPTSAPRDRQLEQLFEEERQTDHAEPDVLLDRRRAFAWGMEDQHAS